MFQPHACGPNSQHIQIIDTETGKTSIWDYGTGVEAVTRNPQRYRVATMSDEHDQHVREGVKLPRTHGPHHQKC